MGKTEKGAIWLDKNKISAGTEYVGVLLIGEKFKPVWVGNRIEQKFLYKNKKGAYAPSPFLASCSALAFAFASRCALSLAIFFAFFSASAFAFSALSATLSAYC